MSWRGSLWFGALASLVTGALFAASLGVGPIGPLALIAPIPLLIYTLSARGAWSVALAALIARTLGDLSFAFTYASLPPVMVVGWIGVQAVPYALILLATRWIARGAPPWMALFSYPLLLTAAEFLFTLVSPHGAFGATGHALVDVLPLLQIASIGGLAALSFTAALVPMLIALLVATPQRWRTLTLLGGAPLALILAFGAVRLSETYETTTRIGLVGIDAMSAYAYGGANQALEAASVYADEVRKLATQTPDFVVLPEKQFAGGGDVAPSITIFKDAAREVDAPVLVGFDEILSDGRRVNSARLITASGAQEIYLKRKPIPGVELGYSIGNGALVLENNVGVAICKDMDFAPMIRDYGARGVTLMLAPAWDFVKDGRLHARMAVIRGVENGFALARAATDGRLTLSDRYGRIVAEAVTSRERPVTLVGDLGLRSGGTFYARFGDIFGWLVVAAATLLIAARLYATIRKPR